MVSLTQQQHCNPNLFGLCGFLGSVVQISSSGEERWCPFSTLDVCGCSLTFHAVTLLVPRLEMMSLVPDSCSSPLFGMGCCPTATAEDDVCNLLDFHVGLNTSENSLFALGSCFSSLGGSHMSEGVSEEDWSSDETSFLSSSAARGTVNFTPSDEGIQRVQQQTTGSEELQQPKLDINPERKTAQPTSGLAKPAVPGQPTASSAEVKTSGECMAAKADEPEKKSNCGRPDGKFPLHAKGRCSHKDHWSVSFACAVSVMTVSISDCSLMRNLFLPHLGPQRGKPPLHKIFSGQHTVNPNLAGTVVCSLLRGPAVPKGTISKMDIGQRCPVAQLVVTLHVRAWV